MNLDRPNQWLTFLANVGVLGGLIFIALEVQQNTNAIRASAIQESTDVAREQILTLVTNPDLIRMSLTEFDQRSEEDQQRSFWFSRSYWLGMQGLYRQWELDVLPDPEWGVWNKVICANYAREVPEFWAVNASTLIPDFVRLVESCSGEVEGVLPFEPVG